MTINDSPVPGTPPHAAQLLIKMGKSCSDFVFLDKCSAYALIIECSEICCYDNSMITIKTKFTSKVFDIIDMASSKWCSGRHDKYLQMIHISIARWTIA